MKKIINYIMSIERGKTSFFKKKQMKNKKTNKHINRIKNILQRWWPSEFYYNYFIDKYKYYYGDFYTNSSIYYYYFYVLYDNKLYKYYIEYEDKNKEIINIKIIKRFIINPPYYIQISYNCKSYSVEIIKPKSLLCNTVILSKMYEENKRLYEFGYFINSGINKRITIDNNYNFFVNYKLLIHPNVQRAKREYYFQYIYNDNNIYYYPFLYEDNINYNFDICLEFNLRWRELTYGKMKFYNLFHLFKLFI